MNAMPEHVERRRQNTVSTFAMLSLLPGKTGHLFDPFVGLD